MFVRMTLGKGGADRTAKRAQEKRKKEKRKRKTETRGLEDED